MVAGDSHTSANSLSIELGVMLMQKFTNFMVIVVASLLVAIIIALPMLAYYWFGYCV